MEIKKETAGEVMTIFPKGDIDTTTAPELEEYLNTEIRDGNKVILDMKRVNYLSSAGLRVILNLMKVLGYDNLLLRNLTPGVKEIFQMTGFDQILHIEA